MCVRAHAVEPDGKFANDTKALTVGCSAYSLSREQGVFAIRGSRTIDPATDLRLSRLFRPTFRASAVAGVGGRVHDARARGRRWHGHRPLRCREWGTRGDRAGGATHADRRVRPARHRRLRVVAGRPETPGVHELSTRLA